MQIQVAENIRKFRMAQGFTQGDLAMLLSVSTQAVSRWEMGKTFPDITLLPLLANYLHVSIDVLLGQDGRQSKYLKEELYRRKQEEINNDAEQLQNELRIFEIYEELGKTEDWYLGEYFQRLMRVKREHLKIKDLDERIVHARQLLRDRMRVASMSARMDLLCAVACCEDDDKLELWADEYTLPEHMHANIWDELMLSRYAREGNTDQQKRQTQKILHQQIENIVHYLTPYVRMKEQEEDYYDPERYQMALDTLLLYSKRVDDIFIFDRIVVEEKYARALLFNGRREDSLAMYSQIAEQLSILYHLPEACVLCGSVPCLNTVQMTVGLQDKLGKCVMKMEGYDQDPLFDPIRNEKCFVAYLEAHGKFFPQQPCRVWAGEYGGEDTLDAQWEMLLRRAKQEAEQLSDGEVVVMLTGQGTVAAVSFPDADSAIDAEGAIKALLEIKKRGNAQIERLLCMWHEGDLDLPSFAFREALLGVDSANASAKILMNGLTGYVVKTVKATMPKGYLA